VKIVIVGDGPGGVELAKRLAENHEVTIVEKEDLPHYTKPMMSHYIAGDMPKEQLFPYSLEWYEKRGIKLLLKTEAKRIDLENRVLQTDSGPIEFEVLVLATGARPRRILIAGEQHLLTLRTWKDAERLKEMIEREKDLLIIGGGFIGLELAGNLSRKGYRVKIVEKTNFLLGLDKELTEKIKMRLQNYGVEFFLGRDIKRVEEGFVVTDKEEIPARLVLCAIGIVPETTLAKESGLKLNKGILVDRRFRTSAPNVYAIGDCAEYDGIISGTARSAMEQAKVLAKVLNGQPGEYDFHFRSSYFKFADLPIAIIGRLEGEGKWLDDNTKAFYKNDEIVGVVVLEDMKSARSWETKLRSFLNQG
jgi:nitrite reductase (NADH) large subunit